MLESKYKYYIYVLLPIYIYYFISIYLFLSMWGRQGVAFCLFALDCKNVSKYGGCEWVFLWRKMAPITKFAPRLFYWIEIEGINKAWARESGVLAGFCDRWRDYVAGVKKPLRGG